MRSNWPFLVYDLTGVIYSSVAGGSLPLGATRSGHRGNGHDCRASAQCPPSPRFLLANSAARRCALHLVGLPLVDPHRLVCFSLSTAIITSLPSVVRTRYQHRAFYYPQSSTYVQ